MDKYYYFGEFGYLNLEILGGLEEFFKRNPKKVIEVATYKNYGMLLKYLFPKNVKIRKVKLTNDIDRSGHESSITYKGSNLHELITYSKIKSNKKIISEDLISTYLSKPLGINSLKKQYISIFPRNRLLCPYKNISETDWDKINLEIKKESALKIVLHGVAKEKISLKGEFIYPKNVTEQIYYLNRSICCLCPDSGFAHFSLNCGCNTLIIGKSYWPFSRYNPFNKKMFITNKDYLFKSKILERFVRDRPLTISESLIMSYYKFLCLMRRIFWYPLRQSLFKISPAFFDKVKKKYINIISSNK